MSKDRAFQVRRYSDWVDVPHHWRNKDCAPTPFQTDAFLTAWYETLGRQPGYEPLILEVLAPDTETAVALWPLVIRTRSGLREISFVDDEVSDNCAPLLRPNFQFDSQTLTDMWQSLRRAFPAADVLRFEKMPLKLFGQPNPLAVLGGTYSCPLTRNVLHTPNSFEEYSQSRTTKFSKEQRRVWRVFLRHDGARYDLLADKQRALSLFEQMEQHQSKRLAEMGAIDRSGQPVYHAFSRRLIASGIDSGIIRFGALTVGDVLVGGLLGLTNGASVSFIRISHAPGQWSACSPGRLVLEKTIEAMHAEGCREFDLSVGDFQYKHAFGIVAEPLVNLLLPLSWRGRPFCIAAGLRQRLKQSPAIQGLRRRLVAIRKPAHGPEKAAPTAEH